MGQSAWFDQLFRPGPDLVLPRRFLVPYLTTLTGDQYKVLLAVYCQWQLSDRPRSVRVRPQEIGQVCDLSTTEVHWILQQLVQIGYLDAPLASDLDGYRVTIAPATQLRE